ncbi:hypothetical protein [Streptomyces sp. NPDC051665]|uniref:hypothetical protein n=1 Tax=Streptomyces sp. NPDC051665 TaxID=3154647 RepID=UPI0034121560
MTVAQAAAALGVSKPIVYRLIREGLTASAGPRGKVVSAREVFMVATKRRVDAVRRHHDLVGFARQIKATIWPSEPERVILSDGREEIRNPGDVLTYVSARKGRDALVGLDSDAVAVFGPAVISTLADLKSLRKAGACSWCWARDLAAVRGGIGPSNTEAVRELIGNPCERDLTEMKTGQNTVDRLWREVKIDDRKRRAQAEQAARSREYEQARADVERATRRLAGAVTASGQSMTKEAARYRQQARRDRERGDEVLARHLESVAAKLERGES